MPLLEKLAGGKASLLDLARFKWVVLGPRDHGYLARRFVPYDINPPDVAITTNSPLLMKELLLARPMIGIAPRHGAASCAAVIPAARPSSTASSTGSRQPASRSCRPARPEYLPADRCPYRIAIPRGART